MITIKQDGNIISATDKSNLINIVGTKVGDTIEFWFMASSRMGSGGGNEIDGVWKINADASKFEGKWHTDGGGGASGKWNLTKIESDVAQIPDISGTYISETTYSGSGPNHDIKTFMKKINRKEITLEQTGNAISESDGSKYFKIFGTREGNAINYYVISPGNQINGTWEIYTDATEMVGKWSSEDGRGGTSGKWNLKRLQ